MKQTIYYTSLLRDMLVRVDAQRDPFLYHLPDMMETPHFSNIDSAKAVEFFDLATRNQRELIVTDALKILNKLIDPVDGSLITPSRDMFYENRNFFWRELGNHTSPQDVILHIFNKTIFFMSLGKS